MKPPVYPHAVLVTFSLGLFLLPMGCQMLSVSLNPTSTELESPSSDAQILESQGAVSSTSTLPSSAPTPRNLVDTNKAADNNVVTYQHGNRKKAVIYGSLRMSNQTHQPVRLALLSRHSFVKGSKSWKGKDAESVHWDFAPKEGNEKGLVLALPNGNLKLEKGDILVAFAQDGSRRYWGPYVVGETSSPSWNSQNKEWELVLRY